MTPETSRPVVVETIEQAIGPYLVCDTARELAQIAAEALAARGLLDAGAGGANTSTGAQQ